MKFRKAGAGDAAALVDLYARVGEELDGGAPVDRAAVARSVARFTAADGDDAPYLMIAEPEAGGAPLGALSVQRLQSIVRARPHLLVGDVVTAPGARRKGVARRLLAEVERLARAA